MYTFIIGKCVKGVGNVRVTLCNQAKITKLILPNRVEGSFWLVDEYLNNNILSIV